MDYVKGDYGTSVLDERMTFGGISDLYLETRSNTRIDIELIEVDGEIKQVNTFQPIEKPGDPESEDESYIQYLVKNFIFWYQNKTCKKMEY